MVLSLFGKSFQKLCQYSQNFSHCIFMFKHLIFTLTHKTIVIIKKSTVALCALELEIIRASQNSIRNDLIRHQYFDKPRISSDESYFNIISCHILAPLLLLLLHQEDGEYGLKMNDSCPLPKAQSHCKRTARVYQLTHAEIIEVKV